MSGSLISYLYFLKGLLNLVAMATMRGIKQEFAACPISPSLLADAMFRRQGNHDTHQDPATLRTSPSQWPVADQLPQTLPTLERLYPHSSAKDCHPFLPSSSQ
jgi:hypothetical protein